MSTAKRTSSDALRALVCMAVLRIGKLNAEFVRLLFFQRPLLNSKTLRQLERAEQLMRHGWRELEGEQ